MSEEVLKPLTIIDCNGNIVAQIPYQNDKVHIEDIVSHILVKFAQVSTELNHIKANLQHLQTDIEDQREAFEHADDSLQNLRQTVSSLDVTKGANV
jgi:methyl-accepting chemotaxis protein